MTVKSGSSSGGGSSSSGSSTGSAMYSLSTGSAGSATGRKKDLSGATATTTTNNFGIPGLGTTGEASRSGPLASSVSTGEAASSGLNIRPADTSGSSLIGAASLAGGGGISSNAAVKGRPSDGAVDTTVTQTPAAGKPAVDGAEGTTITNGPRSDFSVVLAGQVGRRPERSAARSNNFVSLVGGAGGLGRRTSEAKRSLIGGA